MELRFRERQLGDQQQSTEAKISGGLGAVACELQ